MATLNDTQLKNKVNQFFTSNGNGDISGPQSNEMFKDIIDSKGNLTQDVTVTGQSFGSYNIGDVIPQGTNLSTVIMNMLTTVIPATYNQPTASFGISNQALTVEVGEVFEPNLQVNFDQNDAGALIEIDFRADGSILVTQASTSYIHSGQKRAVPTTVVYDALVKYEEGPQLNDNLGNPSGNPIPQGSIDTNNVSIKVRYKTWYQKNVATPADSADVRALANNVWDNVDVINVPIEAGDTSLCFAIPPNKEVVSIEFIGTLTVDQTSNFTQTNVDVNGADGSNPVSHKVYRYEPAAAFSANASYKIKLQDV